MSKLIKKVFKGIKKVFKAIKKVVKKVLKSKIFKVIAIAAAVVFTAGMAVPGLMGSIGSAVGLGGAAASTTGFGALGGMSAALGGTGAAAAGAAGAVASTGGVLGSIGAAITANPALASSVVSTAGSMISGAAKAKADQEAYDKAAKELEENNSYQLKGVKDRMAAVTAKAVSPYKQQEGKYYDPKEDEYKPVQESRNVNQPNAQTDADKDRNI